MRRLGVYALYKGDRFIDLGTTKELSERTGISPTTLRWYTSPANMKRRGEASDARIVIKIGDNMDEDSGYVPHKSKRKGSKRK